MNLLERNQPRLWSVLQGRRVEGRASLQQTPCGMPTLLVAAEDTSPTALHDAEDPLREADEWVNAQDVKPGSVVVVLGIGLGYHVLKFAQQHLDQINRLILVEPDLDVLSHTLGVVDWPEPLLAGKVTWLGGEPSGLDSLFSTFAGDLADAGLTLLRYEPSIRSAPRAIGHWQRELIPCADRVRASYMGLLLRGAPAQRNVYTNLSRLLHSHPLDAFRGLATGLPGFVVGGGPSLDKNIDLIHEASRYGPIVAVDTALYPLRAKGVEPDAVLTRDPTAASGRKLVEEEFPENSVLVFHPESHPRNVERAPGERRVWVRDGAGLVLEKIAPLLDCHEKLTRSTNVGHLAFCVANLLGCDPIVMVGMDLALGEQDGLTHATGAAYSSQSVVTKNGESVEIDGPSGIERVQVVTVEGWNGKPLITLSQFRRYLHHLEKEIQATKARVIDSTEGGAEKRGAYPSPLSAVLEDLEEPESPRHKIATLLRAVPDRSEAVAETTELLKKARALLAEGRDGLAWFKGDALGLLDRVVPENFDELQDEMATPWLAVYESELFQLVVGSAGGRLIHRVARTTPEPFRSLREGLDWLRATYASFLEDAVTLLDEFAHRLGKALTDANSQD